MLRISFYSFLLLEVGLVIAVAAEKNSLAEVCFYLESGSCLGGNQTLSRFLPEVLYNGASLDWNSSNCIPLNDFLPPLVVEGKGELEMVQFEHGGGECNCLGARVSHANLTANCS